MVTPEREWGGVRTTGGLTGVTVCCFGHYDRDYARNRIVRKALRRAGAEVVEVWEGSSPWFWRNRALLRDARLASFDAMVVGFPGYSDMPLARLVCSRRGVPLVFDPFVSQFDTHTADRRKVAPASVRGRFLYHLDRIACRLADLVILDTEAHRRYFADHVGVSLERSAVVPVGADDEELEPTPEPPTPPFRVAFYGTYMPLHGADVVVRAAQRVGVLAPDIRFVMIGRGQTLPAVRDYVRRADVKNVELVDRVDRRTLRRLLADAHVCLGIFGTTGKATRVVPNKVYDGMSLARAVVTADTEAAREMLVHDEHALLIPPGNAAALADAVLRLRDDDALRHRIAAGGRELFIEHAGIDALSLRLTELLVGLGVKPKATAPS